jgi:UDP-3-O-[3-hydroxymyristoyl] N-acetylglucosamine deacetylase
MNSDYVHCCTIKKRVRLEGVGIHSGKKCSVILQPSVNTGIVFNLKKSIEQIDVFIKLHPANIINTINQLTIGTEKHNISLIEHLISAFSGLGITDCIVDTSSVEIPGMDGSAYNFVEAIEEAGIKFLNTQCKIFNVPYPVWVVDKERYLIILPSDDFSINCTFSSPHQSIGTQTYFSTINPNVYKKEISKARTFGFIEDYEKLKKRGVCLGSSFNNTLALSKHRVLSAEMRYENEVVRHKTLDVIGDIYLLNSPMNGRIITYNNNHKLDYELVLKLMTVLNSQKPSKNMVKEQYKKFELMSTKIKNLSI